MYIYMYMHTHTHSLSPFLSVSVSLIYIYIWNARTCQLVASDPTDQAPAAGPCCMRMCCRAARVFTGASGAEGETNGCHG